MFVSGSTSLTTLTEGRCLRPGRGHLYRERKKKSCRDITESVSVNFLKDQFYGGQRNVMKIIRFTCGLSDK